jgi:hypothetical protein
MMSSTSHKFPVLTDSRPWDEIGPHQFVAVKENGSTDAIFFNDKTGQIYHFKCPDEDKNNENYTGIEWIKKCSSAEPNVVLVLTDQNAYKIDLNPLKITTLYNHKAFLDISMGDIRPTRIIQLSGYKLFAIPDDWPPSPSYFFDLKNGTYSEVTVPPDSNINSYTSFVALSDRIVLALGTINNNGEDSYVISLMNIDTNPPQILTYYFEEKDQIAVSDLELSAACSTYGSGSDDILFALTLPSAMSQSSSIFLYQLTGNTTHAKLIRKIEGGVSTLLKPFYINYDELVFTANTEFGLYFYIYDIKSRTLSPHTLNIEFPQVVIPSEASSTIRIESPAKKEYWYCPLNSQVLIKSYGEEVKWHKVPLPVKMRNCAHASPEVILQEMRKVPELNSFPPGVVPICATYASNNAPIKYNEAASFFQCSTQLSVGGTETSSLSPLSWSVKKRRV